MDPEPTTPAWDTPEPAAPGRTASAWDAPAWTAPEPLLVGRPLRDLPEAVGRWSSPDRGLAPHDRGIVRGRYARHTRRRGVGESLAHSLKPAVVAAEASLEARHEERR